MPAGMTAPPIAHNIGRAACRGVANAPPTTSRLISKPTSRKKMAIRPSLIHRARGYKRWIDSVSNPRGRLSNASKDGPKGELAMTNEITTKKKRTIPPKEGEPSNFWSKTFMSALNILVWLKDIRGVNILKVKIGQYAFSVVFSFNIQNMPIRLLKSIKSRKSCYPLAMKKKISDCLQFLEII